MLTDDERETLARWARRRTSSQALALRCRIVLESATGATNKDVADRLGVEAHTVSRWRARFVRDRLEGLTDEPRPGGPRKITDDQVEEVVVKTLEATPKDATHWSTRSMAKEVGLSQSAVSRIWRTFGLKPHLADTFKLSKDPQFIEKVRDVVGLYLAPPEHALVLCVDEKTQIQALDRSAPVLPMMPGMPERRTHNYVRGGVTTLFAALNTATGAVIGQIHRRHRAVEFRKFLVRIDKEVPDGLDVHLICDNASTHKTPAVQRWLAAHPALPRALHPHQQLLAQPGRAVVRPAHRQAATTRRPQERPGPGEGHPHLDQDLERRPQTLRLDKDRRRDPRTPRRISEPNSRLKTLMQRPLHPRASPACPVRFQSLLS